MLYFAPFSFRSKIPAWPCLHASVFTLLSGSGSAGSSFGMKRSTLLSEPCRLWPRPSKRWGLLRAAHRNNELVQSFASIHRAHSPVQTSVFLCLRVCTNIPSADCRNGSGGSSWEGGAAPSSSSSCSVPICIPEYWLSLPSSTLCTETRSKHLKRGTKRTVQKHKQSACKEYLKSPHLFIFELDLLDWGQTVSITTTTKTASQTNIPLWALPILHAWVYAIHSKSTTHIHKKKHRLENSTTVDAMIHLGKSKLLIQITQLWSHFFTGYPY